MACARRAGWGHGRAGARPCPVMSVTAGDITIEVAASIGVVAIDEMRYENEDELLAAADRAMYRVKSLRRDP